MILIISNIANEAAARLVELFPPGAASLITASSFHQSFRGGFDVNDFASSRININGAEVSVDEITGVVTTISSFIPEEFYYIEPADRNYVCAEMNAFFIYFLSQLNCKKINPPSVRSFSGPNLNRIEWVKKASAKGVPIWPLRIVNSQNMPAEMVGESKLSMHCCSVIGDKTIGEPLPDLLGNYLFDLQDVFGLPFLSCHFISNDQGMYYLAEIATKPDIFPAANREAIVNYFL